MDDSFNNVVEGTRQFFMGLPKPQQDGSGQQMWLTGSSTEEGTPALSGAPAATSRPPSAAAAPPSTPTPTPVNIPHRPPSEPLEPEPHIIHKATVMREAAEKRREQPEIEDEEEAGGALSPPSHIIRKPTPHTMSSPAPASAVPSPSPVRPPSAAPPAPPTAPEPIEIPAQYRTSVHRVQTPTMRPHDHYSSSRADPYAASRQTESFLRYQYDPNSAESGRLSHGSSIASPQPSVQPRQSPQTYARITNALPPHPVNRLSDATVHNSTILHRYSVPAPQQPPPHNDRVPPIHHPQIIPPPKIHNISDSRTSQMYKNRESSVYSRSMPGYDRHPPVAQRKYDSQQTYSGYRPSAPQLSSNISVEKHHQVQYKHGHMNSMSAHYTTRPPDRASAPAQPLVHEHPKIVPRVDSKSSYNYPIPSTSSMRYVHSSSSINQSNPPASVRPGYPTVTPKSNYDYPSPIQLQTSPSRSMLKVGCQNPQSKMTVSVTAIVNEMNQTKQRRESPLDLSVKTVKNSADSSTTQDDVIDSVSMKNENLSLQARSSANIRSNVTSLSGYASHKVDFAPDFSQYRERVSASHAYNISPQPSHSSLRHSEVYPPSEPPRVISEPASIESRHQVYADRNKYPNVVSRNDYVPRIDLTRTNCDDRHLENRIRDDRYIIIEERKRLGGPDVGNIPKKIVKYETWSSDSRIDRLSQSAREQRELMSRPVYNYTSHKQLEAYQNDQKRPHAPNAYRDQHQHVNHRYSSNVYPVELPKRDMSHYHVPYHDKMTSGSSSSRHIIQKIPSHPQYSDRHSGAQPADKKVLSILRNSLETKQSYIEPTKSAMHISDLIVIDDGDDPVIEITDSTEDAKAEPISKRKPDISNHIAPILGHHIQMPKAVDSISRDDVRFDPQESKTKSPENDVASRIRTKAELKVMPPSQDNSLKHDAKIIAQNDEIKVVPKSQKQHLFNQIREDNLRLESVIKSEKPSEIMPDVKSEPMCIEDIEKDAVLSIKTESISDAILNNSSENTNNDLDMDWANACDSFMEQLKVGCHKKKLPRKRNNTTSHENESIMMESESIPVTNEKTTESIPSTVTNEKTTGSIPSTVINEKTTPDPPLTINIKQEPIDEEEPKVEKECEPLPTQKIEESGNKSVKGKGDKKTEKKGTEKIHKNKIHSKNKTDKTNTLSSATISVKKEIEEVESQVVKVKEESESTDDDEPLIKSKLLKEKEQSDRLKYQMLKDLSEKSAYVKLECCDDRMSARNSIDSINREKEVKTNKGKLTRHLSKSKEKSSSDGTKNEKTNDSTSDSDEDAISVASRLRVRKSTKTEDTKTTLINKTPVKTSPSKKVESSSASSTPLRKSGFGDGSDFHPGWEEELYRYKRSLRMPTRLIAIPRGRSGGPFFLKTSATQLMRGSTSLPDLDPVPLSPAPSSAQSAATDDIYRRQEKHTLDSDLESNSSCSVPNARLQYDSEASTSTIFSATKTKRKGSSSIVDVLIKKCGKKDDSKKRLKDKDDKSSKVITKATNTTELLPTPSLGLVKSGNKGNLGAKKEKLMEDIFYLGPFRKETVTMFRTAFINDTNGLIGATEEFSPVVLKSRTRTESRVLKHRATIKEVFGDDRPASAPPSSCREEFPHDTEEESPVSLKKEIDIKQKMKTKTKGKLKRSSSIRDGLRSTKSLKRNDAKGRMMRLKKRNSILKSFPTKRTKETPNNKIKKDKSPSPDDKDVTKEDNNIQIPSTTEPNTKKRFKRLFGRRKFSSGFDYIRKKKKIIRRDNSPKVRRQAPKPSPESVHDIQKEIKGWFINKSIGETHLHRAARLGFTDCVAYCLEKMKADPSAKDNAGFTPLHVASAKGHVRIARLLLQYGANVSAAAQGGIRPLHEACENSHVEVIRLLLAYGADPILGTYAGQTPEELAEGPAAKLLRLHIADVQGLAVEPWIFPSPAEIIDREGLGCDPLSSPPPASPPPPPDSMIEIQCSEAPLPPFYSLRTAPGQPSDGLWCLLQDITNVLQIKSKESLLKQIHCGSGSPKELLREIRTQEFLERAQCHQLLCAGEKVNVRASKVALIRVTDKLRQLLKIETALVS